MGDAIFITLEHEIPDYDANVSAVALARSVDALGDVADQLGVRPLADFFSQSEEDKEQFMDSDEVELDDDLDVHEEQWFEPAEGLNAIRSMIDYFAEHPGEAEDGVVEDLNALEQVLAHADEHHIRWHLEIDF